MNDYVVDTIDLTPTSRLVVEYDQDSSGDSPLSWNNESGISVHVVRLGRGYVAPDAPGGDTHGEALDAILENLDGEAAQAAIELHFKRAGLPYKIVDMAAQHDWVGEFIWYVEADAVAASIKAGELSPAWSWDGDAYIQGYLDEYQAWANGEVYGVTLERRQAFMKQRVERTETGFDVDLTVEPELFDEWEVVESIWSCYLNQDYTARQVALEYFPLTDEEKVACNGATVTA